MKTGKTLQSLAIEVDRQANAIVDFRADTRKMMLTDTAELSFTDPLLQRGNNRQISDLAHSQIAGRLNIPQKYYDLMLKESPALLADNVNHWFGTKHETRLIRTLDNRVRAFLSSSYRPLDNFKLVETVLPKLQKLNATIESAEITERNLYIKAVFNQIEGTVEKGDIVKMGLIVSNSEVGCGSLKVEPLIYRLVCKNGMIVADSSIRKYHVGRRSEEDNAQEYFRNATRNATRIADDKAFWMKVRDVIDATVNKKHFDKIVADLQRAKEHRSVLIEADPAREVEAIANKYRMTEGEEAGVLTHLIKGGDLSTYGMIQAVTRTSQDLPDYDRATEFERIGGEILLNLN